MENTITSLSIKGYQNSSVPNTFIQQSHNTQHLVLVLPGLGYSASAPVLYYTTKLLLDHGADVLQVEYAYHQQAEFQNGSDEERLRRIQADAMSAYQAVISQRDYARLTLVGKSLGTLGMGHLLTAENLPPQVEAIWLTPLLRVDHLCKQIQACPCRSLLVIGTGDPHYDATHLSEIQKCTDHETLTIDGVDHCFDLKNRVLPTIRVLEKIICALERFLSAEI